MTLRRSCRAGFSALLFCLCSLSPLLSRAQQTPGPNPSAVAGRTAWDANYLYLAFQVDDANLTGTNSAPLSNPEQDDSVAVYLQVGPARPDAPDANTHALVVSAAGGFTFLSGGANNGPLTPRSLRDLLGGGRAVKVAVTLQGTLNRPADRDQRFTVEMAIPWNLVGVAKPEAGLVLGWNVVARSRGERATALATLGQPIAEADVARPSKFATLTLRETSADVPASAGSDRAAPRVNEAAAPRVDGVLTAAEWPDRSLFAFAAPDKTAPASSAAPTVAVTPLRPAPLAAVPRIGLDAANAATVERLIFARYVLGFQGDPRKPIAFRGVRAAPGSGRFLLSDQPAEGAGPWFSADRPAWHRQQLLDMRRLGVDVALAVVGGPRADANLADEKALMVLVSALQQMRENDERAPQIALYLDTARLVAPGDARPDLSIEAGRETLYQAVKRWMDLVPPEMRARIQLPLAAGGARAYPIFLSSAAPLSGLGEAGNDWVGDLRARFARDFGSSHDNATLLVVGASDFAPTTSTLAAYLPPLSGSGGPGTGPVSTFVIQPGYDDTGARLAASSEAAPILRARRDGAAYRETWEAALKADPRWIIVDSWNDFARGTEVAASRQYGPRYLDQTRIYAIQVSGLPARDVKWLGHDAPHAMRPLQVAAVNVLLQNAGVTPLRGADGYALTYRWLQNDKVVADSPLRVRVPGALFPTQTVRLPVGVAATRVTPEPIGPNRPKNAVTVPKIEPLPPGDYVLEIDMAQVGEDNKPVFFGENGDAPLRIPVRITADDAPDAAVFLGTTTPPLVQAGATYPVEVRLRWMGRDTLPAGAGALTYQLLSPDGSQTIVTGTVSINQALAPGQSVTARANVRFADASGSAIASAYPEASAALPGAASAYRLRWLLTRTNTTEAVAGAFEERVAVYPDDREAALFVSPGKVPATLQGAELVSVPVIVQNAGPTKWAKGELFVGYHWFFPDGIEAVWRPPVTVAIDREVEPGRSVTVNVPVRAPERDGEYVLAFDALRAGNGDAWLSVQPLTGNAADLALSRVRVTGGSLVYADLSKTYNVDAVSPASAPGDGDLDGTGATLPAEDFPPDAFGLLAAAPSLLVPPEGKKKPDDTPAPAYPSGYYADVSPTARRIGFRYGPKAPGAKNAVACQGQTIAVPAARYNGLNLAAASTTGEDKPLTLTLRYKDGVTETVTRLAASWTRAAGPREAVAVQTPRKRTPAGDVPQTCALRHLIVPVNLSKELVSITLPNDPAIKIFALTLEK